MSNLYFAYLDAWQMNLSVTAPLYRLRWKFPATRGPRAYRFTMFSRDYGFKLASTLSFTQKHGFCWQHFTWNLPSKEVREQKSSSNIS